MVRLSTSLVQLLPVLAATSTHAAPASVPGAVEKRATCNKGAYIIYARDFFEDNDNSALLEVAKLVSNAIPDSVSVPVQYPAAQFKRGWFDRNVLGNSEFAESREAGLDHLSRLVRTYHNECLGQGRDRARIVLLGFGSGAAVVTEALQYWSDKSLPSERGVVAAATFGDPTHAGDMPYNEGSTTRDGVDPRPKSGYNALPANMAKRLRDFCEFGDPFCDGGDRWDQHNTGVHQRAQRAADFIIDVYNNGKNGPYPDKNVDIVTNVNF
ncbi:hypothetical protein NLU13_0046 [Sarocladium strictum]|uniref:Cutinase n=1 Tax=Sarocladium strictum TaxID=5046 RepID=A0AA39LAX3_SARSR|nr:hypothetical protein NLU13_0046 [Sarocladium strictum]